MVSQRNICYLLLTESENLGMGPGKTVSQLLNISFDMTAWEILASLIHDATLLIRDRDFIHTAVQANVIIATPSILTTLDPRQCVAVQTFAIAGEPCALVRADSWAEKCNFYNGCGPTETTIVNTVR